MEHESDGDPNCDQRFRTGTEGLRNKRTSEDQPNDSIIKIGQNTEKSPGGLLSLRIQ